MHNDIRHKRINTNRWAFRMISAALSLFFLIACGPNQQERQAQEEKKRNEAAKQQDIERNERLAQAGLPFGVIRFPSPDIRPDAFTIELQRYFQRLNGQPIVFEAVIEDLEQAPDGIILTASRSLHETDATNGVLVVFRLHVDLEKANNILAVVRKERKFIFRDKWAWRSKDSIIVGQINSLKSIRDYETPVLSDIKESINAPARFLAEGQLLSFSLIPKKEEQTEVSEEARKRLKPSRKIE